MSDERRLVIDDLRSYGVSWLSPSALQSFADRGDSIEEIRGQWKYVLADFTDAEVERVLTYPRVSGHWLIGDIGEISLDDDGGITSEGWFRPGDTPAVIAALERAAEIVAAWGEACDRWEASNQ